LPHMSWFHSRKVETGSPTAEILEQSKEEV
jgi:hypothetical protein